MGFKRTSPDRHDAGDDTRAETQDAGAVGQPDGRRRALQAHVEIVPTGTLRPNPYHPLRMQGVTVTRETFLDALAHAVADLLDRQERETETAANDDVELAVEACDLSKSATDDSAKTATGNASRAADARQPVAAGAAVIRKR